MTSQEREALTLLPQEVEPPHPPPTSLSQQFWTGCSRGELLLQRCNACSEANFSPAEHCRTCLSRDLTWERSGGRGRLYSWTVVHRPVLPSFATPYAPAIVTLDEGYQMVTNIVDAVPDELTADMRVRVLFADVGNGLILPYFTPER